MTLKQFGRSLLAALLLSLPLSATVQVTAHLTDPSGSPASVAYVRFELTNCGFNVPAVPSQPLSVVWKHIDLRPDKNTGLATATIFGNDEILCGGSQSSLWHVTAFSNANTAIAGDKDYLILASLGAWEFSAAQPFTGNRPPPGFQVVFANPVANQTIVQPAGTSLAITGTFDLTNATVIGFNGGGGGGSGIGISINGSNVGASALNFGATPTAPSGALNVTWQRDALNPASASAYIAGATSSTLGLIQLGGDIGGTAAAPFVTSLHLPAALTIAQGGTGQSSSAAAFNAIAPSTAQGGLIVATGANAYGNLALGSSGKVLTSNGTTAVWSSPAAGSIAAGTTNLLTRYTDGINSVLGAANGISDDNTKVSFLEPAYAKSLNNIQYADQQAGADASVKINAAIAALPSTGGEVDARGFQGIQTISQTLNVGNGTKCVTLRVAAGVNFGITITNSTPAVKIFDCSGVVSDSLAFDTNAPRFQLASTAHVSSIVTNDQSANQASFLLKGVTLYGNATAVVDNAMLDLSLINNKSLIENVVAANQGSKLLWIHNSGASQTGDFTFRNAEFDGNSVATAQPCVIEDTGTGSIQDLVFDRGGCEHAGTGFPQLLVDGHGAAVINTLRFDRVRFETNASDAATELIRIKDAAGITITDPVCSPLAGSPANYCVTLAETVPGLTRSFKLINGTIGNGNLVNNLINSDSITGLYLNDYSFLSPTFVSGGNKDTAKIGGMVFAADNSVTVPTATVSTTLTASGSFDASAASSTMLRTGAGAPNNGTCTQTGQEYFQTDGTAGQEKWFCKGGVWSQQLNSGAGGASVTLNNLGATAINADLLPSGTRHLGATTTPWADIFVGSASGNTLKLTGTFTANRVATFPDATDTVAELGQANTFSAANTFNANVLFGASGRLVSGATGAPTSACVICFGSADRARYGTNSFNLIGTTSASSPVQLGDTPGVSVAGVITSVTNGQNLSVQPLAAPTNTAGGSVSVTGGNGNGTGANGDLILAGGSGGSAGTGFVQVNSGATVPCANAPGGTSTNSLVSYSSVGCVNTPHGSTLGIAGVCVEGCGISGTAKIARLGSAPLTLDNSGVQGDYVCISASADGKGTDCGTSPTTQTVGAVQGLLSGSIYNVDVNVAGVSNGSATGSVVLAPGANQTIQGTAPTVPALTMKAPASAGASQVIAQMVDNTGANVFNCQQSNGCQAGSGVGGSITLSHIVGPNANPATVGIVEASNGDVIFAGRNNANNADLTATLNASDILAWGAKFQALGLITTTSPIIQNEIAAPSGSASSDVIWADSTTHWPSFNPNNTGTFKFFPFSQVNTQAGANYTVLTSDQGKVLNFTNGGAVAVTLAQATGVWANNASFVVNANGGGTVTVTPTVSTINGGASLAIAAGKAATIFADGGGNYLAILTITSAGAGDMLKNNTNTMGAAGIIDMTSTSATGGFILPIAAGAAPTTAGVLSYDSTGKNPVFGNGTSTTILGSSQLNNQTGVNYTVLTGDRAKTLSFSNAGAVAVTQPQAGASFPNGWYAFYENRGAGAVTITPTVSTVDGAASITLSQNQGLTITSDGTNYFTSNRGTGTGLGDPGGNGFVDRTSVNTTANRTLTGTANQISITNGGGGGNPVFSLDTTHVLTDTNSITKTNLTADAEGTGNVFTRPFYAEFTPGCNNASASSGSFDVPTSAAATFTCFGTTTTQGAGDFVDGSTTTATGHLTLPQGWTGNMDVRISWFANAASANAVRWSVQTGCVADSEAISTGPSYNAASASNTAYTGTANQRKTTTLSAVAMTNCSAGETMYFQVQRIGGDGGDTLTATAEVLSVQFEGRATK